MTFPTDGYTHVYTHVRQLISRQDIIVDESFLGLYDELKQTRKLEIKHGPTMSHSMDLDRLKAGDDDDKTDPRELLVKIMEKDGLRVIDLFRRIDDDASWTLSREEFKAGIKV